ncbi:MAG: tRNA uridine-5-carboxymethylaminomethyl(34) synthesis enzyme MnmG [Christensenellales bacterium]|jgi:tRNA uridine 5-carboxymethylaminomethyl modification enzyme
MQANPSFRSSNSNSYEAIVVGAGHAGCEAALALARLGVKTLLLTLNIDGVAMLACNPSIGGTAKGHLVREIDALGGEMGLAIDDTFLQSRMLNTGKGPAVHSLRTQADKKQYQYRMLKALQHQENLTLIQGEIADIDVNNGQVQGVKTATGAYYSCRACIIATGVYLKSRIIIGEYTSYEGPGGLMGATPLSNSLQRLGFELRRFKTGTPARIDIRSVDLSKLEPQHGDDKIVPFSFMNDSLEKEQLCCYLGYTNERTHDIIRRNLHRAPMFTGVIEGVGPRYCPSIEDKIVRFADKDRHQFFLEPESLFTTEWYVQGMSTSLPEDVQTELYRTLPGLENVNIVRLAYAIEYDCINPTAVKTSLESKDILGLFFAGQINGSSGYEEAAAQGLIAGINAAMLLKEKEPLLLGRADAYIGVLIDDLTTKGTNEPYRMMTSRAEYRLSLRQDNADLRLTELGRKAGLVSDERYDRFIQKKSELEKAMAAIDENHYGPGLINPHLEAIDEPPVKSGISARDILKRANASYGWLYSIDPSLPHISPQVQEQVEIAVRYEGYLRRQAAQTQALRRMEDLRLSENVDYHKIGALRIEARQKLSQVRPQTLGQASRISGVSPGDITVLMVWLEKNNAFNR